MQPPHDRKGLEETGCFGTVSEKVVLPCQKNKVMTIPTVPSVLQECSEGGPGANAGGVQGVQEDQGQTAPPRGAHQQTGFLQIHLRAPSLPESPC